MRNITDIYLEYEIPSNLQEHMLRVAAVGQIVADSWIAKDEINDSFLISALLLHDMGNILKFDLSNPSQLSTEDLSWLKRVQQKYQEKYGCDEHYATIKIAQELHLPPKIVEMLGMKENDAFRSSTHYALLSPDWSLKIKAYADLRVGPHTILTIDERFDDILVRYKGRSHKLGDVNYVELRRQDAHELEKQLSAKTLIDLSKLCMNDIVPVVERLRKYTLPVGEDQ